MNSCGHGGPVVDVCYNEPDQERFRCIDKEQKTYFVAYKNSEPKKYICFEPDDLAAVVNYWKSHCQK